MKRTAFKQHALPFLLLGGFTLTSAFAGCKEKDMSMKMNEPRNIHGVANFSRTFGDLNQKQLNKNVQYLNDLRDRYAASDESQRQTLGEQIRQIESQCERDADAMKAEEKNIRNMEIKALSQE